VCRVAEERVVVLTRESVVKPRRAVIIGVDGLSADLVKRYVEKGVFKSLGELMRRGVFARALPAIPTHTPVNWTTISTGAWPGTHGVTGFSILTRGRSYREKLSGFDTRSVRAEFLWEAAERAGRKCILLKWAGPQFPVTVKKGIQVDGCFCVECIHEISGPRLYSSVRKEEWVTKISVRRAEGWRRLPVSYSEPLEAVLLLGSSELSARLYVLAVDSEGKGYDRVYLCLSKEGSIVGSLAVGEWSEWLRLSFRDNGSSVEGTVRLKLVSLSSDGSVLEIYASQIMPVTGWTYPENIARELVENVGPFLQRVGYIQEGEVYGAWVDYETFLEELEYQHEWFARAAAYLAEKYEWDLFFIHTHAVDYVLDSVISRADPATAVDDSLREYYESVVDRTMSIVDRMIGELVEKLVDEETLVVVVSDHGIISYRGHTSITDIVRDILVKRGFLVYKKRKAIGPATKPQKGEEVDLSRSKAIVHDDVYIYINLKGREPHGVVDPGEYEIVRDSIISALLEYRDPLLKSTPFSLVLRAEDAEFLGLYGDRIGDIVFVAREGGLYNEGHGIYLPTARFGMSSLNAFLLMAGPGVKEGYELKKSVRLVDIAPTVAFLLGFPPPKDSEGSILLEVLSEDFINHIFSRTGDRA